MTKKYEPNEFPVRCEVFSRVVGYIRPVNQWNDGKQEEFRQRTMFDKTQNGVGKSEETDNAEAQVMTDGCENRVAD